MATSSEQPWSGNLNAPNITSSLYFAEKANFAGVLLGAICYGIVAILFLHCMRALLSPVTHTKGGIRWGLVAHTLIMFSFVTIAVGLGLDLQSVSYIEGRDFPGFYGGLAPGPLGYQLLVYSKAISVVPNVMFIMNQLLADGLLLYRCYVIYSMNYWIIAFPCSMYLTCLAMGIMLIDQNAQPYDSFWYPITVNFGLPYFSISLAINVILTSMIVVRLVMHSRNIRNVMGDQATETTGLYKTIIAVLIESSALYTISFLLFIGPWGALNSAQYIFFQPLVQIQVIAPFLITLRVADRRNIGSIRFKSQEETTLSIGHPANSLGSEEEIPDGPGVEAEPGVAIEEFPL